MASSWSTLDTDVEADCCVDSSETDLELQSSGFGTHTEMGVVPKQPKPNFSKKNFGINLRGKDNTKNPTISPSVGLNNNSFFTSSHVSVKTNLPTSVTVTQPESTQTTPQTHIQPTQVIRDEMIEDGAHVVFDWDNTLKLYNRETGQLSCRVSKQFLLHLKNDRHCQLYIISAIRPSALNLSTILSEVDKLGLRDVFVNGSSDSVDGSEPDKVVKAGEYAHKGNIIICGYDKAETFMKVSSFDSSKGDKVMFFDDEIVNINNFSVLVPNSVCYLCE